MKRSLSGLLLLLLPAMATAQGIHPVPDPYAYPQPTWSPYLVGGLIGVLAILTLWISGKVIGASSAYASLAGVFGRLIAPRHIQSLPYYQENKPVIDWTTVFVLGAIGGAFIAAWSGSELNGRFLQDLWVARFGADSHVLRAVFAFAGGSMIAYGARLAGGCTSGHGISGTLQMAVGSWIAVLCFFAGGIAVAMLLYRT